MSHPVPRSSLWLICLVFLAASPSSAPSRQPPPAAPAAASMQKLIHELYARQYADAAPASRKKLANVLLDQAAQTTNDPTARYVLMTEAADLACQARDADAAVRAIDLLSRDFDIEPFDMKVAALRRIVRTLSGAAQAGGAVAQCLNLADEAMLRQDDAAAESLLGLAHAAANQSGQVKLALSVRDRQKELTAFRLEHTAAAEALLRLQAGKATAADRTLIGRMRCFLLDDWSTGLPLLADGADASLKKCAQDELAAGSDNTPAPMNIANGWWDAAQHQPRLQKQQILRHAAHWYRKARPDLSGVNMDIAESRLAQIPLTADETARLRPGLTTDIYSGESFDHFLLRRVDPQIDFDWGTNPIGPTLPRDDFSLRWRGYLLTQHDGNYTFIMIANSGGRLTIDGNTLIDSDKLSRKRNGVSAQIRLSAGAHALRAEAWDGTGTAKAILQWIVPGEAQPVPIPASVLKRE